ncbi:integumentary mucin A.1-like isoform X2 [Telopea speciosissima]|uniref:integumentary mucin A.1-like isoform X2 n=1 Tax=Telopea speciosissima TaxID=54955 RepID=UPI001CC60B0B|nr:integumentary mucin A.1-like isoform X2 [Telopea speciosissima]
MGTRVRQCLIFLLLGIFFCAGSSVTETTLVGATRHTLELDHEELPSSTSNTKRDVITPLATVPVVYPTPITTPPTTTSPVVNPDTPPEAPTIPSPSTTTPTIGSPSTTTPTIGTPSTTTPTIGTPSITTPTIGTPSITTPTTGTPSTTTPITGTPSTTTPTTGTPASSSGSWCVASQSAAQTALQVALDYACGYGGADCSAIQQGGACFNPDTVRDHASYAFNSYYQKNPVPNSCNFGGTAVITNIDPSNGSCSFTSTSTSATILNTTNPTGSTVYGAEPTGSTNSAAFVLRSSWIVFTMECLLVSVLAVRWI